MTKAIIICVDDEPSVLESLRRELSEAFEDQYDLETAQGGEEALELTSELLDEGCEIALVIADYLMPGLKGDVVLEKIHQQSPKTLNIMLTGQAGVDGITHAINHAKLYRYIAKPWESSDLKLTVQEALNSYFQAQQLEEYQHDLEQKVETRTQELSITVETLQKTQAELIRSEKMAALGSLVAGVAHEINTPVGNAILAASVLTGETDSLNESFANGQLKKSLLKSYLETAQNSSDMISNNLHRAADLIQGFKQVAVDQSSHKCRTFKLVEYLHSIQSSLEPQLKKSQHKLTIEGDRDLKLTSFPGALSQVITNFVMNSIYHAYQPGVHGQIRIKVEIISEDKISLIYSDDGCGIPKKNQPKIFDPFFTTARDQGGSGLGLHVVHNVVTQTLQGSIELLSQENQGTTFTLKLPITVTPSSSDHV